MALAPAPTKATAGGTGQSTASPAAGAGVGLVPFTRASYLHTEPAQYDTGNIALSASTQTAPLLTIPAYGFLRGIRLKVTLAGSGGSPALAGDNPFSCITDITLQEPNGSPIFQVNGNGGYNTYLIDKYGGFRGAGQNDPKLVQGYSAAAAASTFWLYIPCELNERDALGALPNQNSSAAFQVRIGINNLAGSFGGTPPTSGTIRIQAFADEWDQPDTNTLGVANETAPPALNTTQFVSQQSYVYNAGQQTIRLTRTGNYIRNLIFVFRTGAGARDATALPAQTTLYLDTQPIDIVDSTLWAVRQSERTGYFGALDAAGAPDTGVFVYDFCHDWNGKIGFETRNQWLPTLSTTRLEISGTFGNSGTLTVLTNDVIISDNVFQGR
jgi:hypothetical protein